MAALLVNHPERHLIQVQLRKNTLLAHLDESAHAELAALLAVEDRHRGEFVLHQGDRQLQQYFVLESGASHRRNSPRTSTCRRKR